MVQINFARKEINCKIVYYGPGLSGKTTNLEVVHARTPETNKGELTSISTDGDRTLFFDFMPLDLGTVAGMKTKFHLYTVPGQVYYNSTRKLVLLGADGIIFIADSSPDRMADNIQSMENLRENLAEMGRDLSKVPLVVQYNKRDIPGCYSVEELEKGINREGRPSFEAAAKSGEGVFQTLKAISGLVLESINSSERGATTSRDERPAAAPVATPEEDIDPVESETEEVTIASRDDWADAKISDTRENGAGLKKERSREQVLRPAARKVESNNDSNEGESLDEDSGSNTAVAVDARSRVRRVGAAPQRGKTRGGAQRAGRNAPTPRVTPRARAKSSRASGPSGLKMMVAGALLVGVGAGAALMVWKFFVMG